MKHILKATGAVLGVVILLAAAFFAGILVEDGRQEAPRYPEYALSKTGLPEKYAPAFCLEGLTGARESYQVIAFKVDYDSARKELLEHTKTVSGWNAAPVTEEELRAFSRSFWYPELLPVPGDTVFDAWYYLETSAPGIGAATAEGCFASIGAIGRGFEFAVFDVETGVMIFVDQFG